MKKERPAAEPVILNITTLYEGSPDGRASDRNCRNNGIVGRGWLGEGFRKKLLLLRRLHI